MPDLFRCRAAPDLSNPKGETGTNERQGRALLYTDRVVSTRLDGV